MQFILESQAKAEIRMQRFDDRKERFEELMEKAQSRTDAMGEAPG